MRYESKVHIRDGYPNNGPEKELQAIPVETLERLSGIEAGKIRRFTIAMGSLTGEEAIAVLYAAVRASALNPPTGGSPA